MLEAEKQKEQEELKEVRKKMLVLAQMMQYDDDLEESAVTAQKQA